MVEAVLVLDLPAAAYGGWLGGEIWIGTDPHPVVARPKPGGGASKATLTTGSPYSIPAG